LKNILIGSRALDYWMDLGIARPDSDWDVISAEPIEGAEWHKPSILNNSSIEQYVTADHTTELNDEVLYVPPLWVLAAIKRSHLHRSEGFGKHITHYHKYLHKYTKVQHSIQYPLGTNISALCQSFMQERRKLTEIEYPQRYPKLDVTVDEFFDDAVPKRFNHDYLHELVQYNSSPMYRAMQRDSSKAMCHEDLWLGFTHQQKLQCVAEEVQVIALERFIIPSKGKFMLGLAYNKALEKVCTTLCSSWFREFAIDNYPELLDMLDKERLTKVLKVLNVL
jgi:hypothetical protein